MKRYRLLAVGLSLLGMLGLGQLLAADDSSGGVKIDPALPKYAKQSGEVTGAINVIGSDTMGLLSSAWAAAFQTYYPDVKAEVDCKGSSTAPPALINGTAIFGPMSRDWEPSEIDDFEKKFGYKPTTLVTSIDMLAVYVNKDCPLESLKLEDVDAIFSSTRKGGARKEITKWGGLGLKGEWADKPISLYGRNASSGTYKYFKEHALFGGDYKPTVKEQPGSSAVVNGVASDRYALGYSGIGYKTADVKAIALDKGKGPVPAAAENAYNNKYPLARPLLLSLNYKPNTALDPLRREFLRFIFSAEGQRAVVKEGYLPLTEKMAAAQMKKVGIEAPGKTAEAAKSAEKTERSSP
ncbi:MAG TPA: phosphate ABC transporter substrate-binding protein [Pirellulales bacterium]|jgi:phosphate transport system substrate-binding protein